MQSLTSFLAQSYYFRKLILRWKLLLQSNSLYCDLHYRWALRRVRNFPLRLPVNIYVETTNLCNSDCLMCPHPRMKRAKGTMDMGVFERIVDNASNSGMREIGLSLMGEPFLDEILFKRVRYIKEKGLRTTFNTNASLLSESNARLLIETEVDEIRISIDAFKKETYERIRVGLCYEKVVSNIKWLIALKKEMHKKYPTITLNYVCLKENYSEGYLFYNYWKDKVDKIIMAFPRDWAGQIGLNGNESIHIGDSIPTKNPCDNLWKDLVVLRDGNVALCCNDYDGKIIMGNVLEQGIMGVWNGERFRYYRKMHIADKRDKLPLCNQCSKYSVWW